MLFGGTTGSVANAEQESMSRIAKERSNFFRVPPGTELSLTYRRYRSDATKLEE
jgi:hypothetical protein